MNDVLTQDYMHSLSTEWRLSITEQAPGEHEMTRESLLTLASCFQYIKYKMYVKRDMCIVVDDAQRRNMCVALYEYTRRIVSMSDSDVEFVERYDKGLRHYTPSHRVSLIHKPPEDAPPKDLLPEDMPLEDSDMIAYI